MWVLLSSLLLGGVPAGHAAISRTVIAHVACEVCEHAVQEAAKQTKEKGSTNEDDLYEIVDRLCTVKKGVDTWLTRLDITRPESEGLLLLQKHDQLGYCRKECTVLQRACTASLEGQEESLVRQLQRMDDESDDPGNVCKKVCQATLPELGEWKDEKFKAKTGLDQDELDEHKHRLGIKGDVTKFDGFGPGGGSGQFDVDSLPASAKAKLSAAMGGGGGGMGGLAGAFGAKSDNQLDMDSIPDHTKKKLQDALHGVIVNLTVSTTDTYLRQQASIAIPSWDGHMPVSFRMETPLEKLFDAYCKHFRLIREQVGFTFGNTAKLSGSETMKHYKIDNNDVIYAYLEVDEEVIEEMQKRLPDEL